MSIKPWSTDWFYTRLLLPRRFGLSSLTMSSSIEKVDVRHNEKGSIESSYPEVNYDGHGHVADGIVNSALPQPTFIHNTTPSHRILGNPGPL